jgi:squamous cell carcinoma antigen recognized by T-cells 3
MNIRLMHLKQRDALAALSANNHELKNRRIAVTLADTRNRPRRTNAPATGSGFGKKADARIRSVRIRNLPPGTQEGLLQQFLEKIASVKRVELFAEKGEAVAELENAAVRIEYPS